MYLCNLKLTGKSLPPTLPDNIRNEVSSMVDIINFSIVDEGGSSTSGAASNAPDFNARQTASPPTIQHPQPQPSNSQLLSHMTGFPGQQTGFLGQPTGMQSQQTGFAGMQNPQPTGYPGPMPPMPPMPTGYGSNLSPAGGPGGMAAPLNAQPTGLPGQ